MADSVRMAVNGPAEPAALAYTNLSAQQIRVAKQRARRAVGAAIRAGLLTREPCFKCGTTDRIQAHHPDYTQALMVVWACEPHHQELHRTQKLASAIQFVLNGLPYRFDVEKPDAAAYRADYERTRQRGQPYAHSIDFGARANREWKRRWRARLLWLKATLEYATGESPEEVARALLAHLVLPSGETMAGWTAKQLPGAFANGVMPPLQLTGGRA